jgi:hypothetical protein
MTPLRKSQRIENSDLKEYELRTRISDRRSMNSELRIKNSKLRRSCRRCRRWRRRVSGRRC